MFLEMRAAEVATIYDPTFTKKEAIQTGAEIVNNFLKQGEADPIAVWGAICRLKEVVNTMDATFRDRLELSEKISLNGVEFTPNEGGYTLNYEEDPVYFQMKKDLADRADLLKLAQKQYVLDGGGNVVPTVSKSPRKSSITAKF